MASTSSSGTDGKTALLELHKPWAQMSQAERDAFLQAATEALYGKGTYLPSAQRRKATGGPTS